jgi:hypothetical protein
MEGRENHELQRFFTLPGRERLHVEFTADYDVALFNSALSFSSLLGSHHLASSPNRPETHCGMIEFFPFIADMHGKIPVGEGNWIFPS